MRTGIAKRTAVLASHPCRHDQPDTDPGQAGLTRTGHVVGRVYFSADHGMHYAVVAATTKWQLAPEDAVALVWENGGRTVTSRRRAGDPECRSYSLG